MKNIAAVLLEHGTQQIVEKPIVSHFKDGKDKETKKELPNADIKSAFYPQTRRVPCAACGGTGKDTFTRKNCPACDGAKHLCVSVPEHEAIQQIPFKLEKPLANNEVNMFASLKLYGIEGGKMLKKVWAVTTTDREYVFLHLNDKVLLKLKRDGTYEFVEQDVLF